MDEQTLQELTKLKHALKAMSKSLNKTLMMGVSEGTGDMVVKNYQKLHSRVVELLSDDFFIETLEVEPQAEASDEHKLSQVQLAVNQLLDYVNSLIREEYSSGAPWSPEFEDLTNLGAEIRDRIVHLTRTTVKSAIANLDFDIANPSETSEEEPVKRKVKVKVKMNDEEDEEAEGEQ